MLESRLRKIENRPPSTRFHLDKVIGVTKNDRFSLSFPTLLAATSFSARAANSSEVLVEHARVANQTHSFDATLAADFDRHSTRAAHDRIFVIGGFLGSAHYSLEAFQSVSLFLDY